MKKLNIIGSLLIALSALVTGVQAQTESGQFAIAPIPAQGIPVTRDKITSVIFPVKIQPVGKGTRDILAQKVKGTDNIVIIKAARAGFLPTNLTVIGANGRLYSLELHYEANPPTCNFRVQDEDSSYSAVPVQESHLVRFSALPIDETTLSADADTIACERSFLRRSTGSQKASLVLKGVYTKDRLLWIAVRVRNHSLVDYPAAVVRFSVRDKNRSRRTAIQERFLKPVYAPADRLVPGDRSRLLVFAFRPFSVPRHKKFTIQVSDEDGGRVLMLRMGCKPMLRARPVK